MAEDLPPSGMPGSDGEAEEAARRTPRPEEGEGKRSARRWAEKRALLWGALGVLLSFSALQGAGILLRDSIEGRLRVLPSPPASGVGAGPAAPAPLPGAASRFGPDVREVEVTEPSSAPDATPGPGAPAAAPPTAAAPPAPSGAKVVDVGLYFSQKYLKQTEGKLAALGLPHFRVESERQGKGVRVSVGAEQKEQGRAVLDRLGYLFREAEGGLEAYFLSPGEARAAAAKLSAEGLSARVAGIKGKRPTWTVYAGPFPAEEAAKVTERLKAQRMYAALAEPPQR